MYLPPEVLSNAAQLSLMAGALHNIAALVDVNAAKKTWNVCYRAGINVRCASRRGEAERAHLAIHTMVEAVRELVHLGQQQPKHAAILECALRSALTLEGSVPQKCAENK